MSCGKCGKWQHIPCHNAKDRVGGRLPRNWDVVDFTCIRCLSSKEKGPASNMAEHMSRPKKANGQSAQRPVVAAPHTDAVVPAASRKVVQEPEPTIGFSNFTHYHHQQRGFSANPSAFQAQAPPRTDMFRPPVISNTHTGWPAHAPYTQFHNQNGSHAPHVEQRHPISSTDRLPAQSGPHFPHQIFNQQAAYNNHAPYRSQV